MIKRWYYRLFYSKYCFRATLAERLSKKKFVPWDVIYLRRGWWFDRGAREKDKRWSKHFMHPANHDCWLNATEVRLSGASFSPNSPTIVNDPVEYYKMCGICGKKLNYDDKGNNKNRADSRDDSKTDK